MKISGMRAMHDRLQRLEPRLRKMAMEGALFKAGEVIRSEMARTAPRASSPSHPELGHLADHMVIKRSRRQINPKDGMGVNIGNDVGYFWAIFLEYGTRRGMSARPYARRSFDSKVQQALRVLVSEMGRALERLA